MGVLLTTFAYVYAQDDVYCSCTKKGQKISLKHKKGLTKFDKDNKSSLQCHK